MISYQLNSSLFPLLPSYLLPLTLVYLKDLFLITVKGVNSINFLQNQLTCDVSLLENNNFSFSGYCNYKGKIFGILYVLRYHADMAIIGRNDLKNVYFREFKKYAAFSKVSISENNKATLFGIIGSQAYSVVQNIFGKVPDKQNPMLQFNGTTILYFNLPTPRFLLITTQDTKKIIQYALKNKFQLSTNNHQWMVLDIEAGYPIVNFINTEKFFPQELNLKEINGISFTKGCYIGQEVISRIQYKGNNKYAVFFLKGISKYIPLSGDKLEIKIRNNWKKTGTVLASYQMIDKSIWVQAILNKQVIAENHQMRVSDDDTSTLIVDLVKLSKNTE